MGVSALVAVVAGCSGTDENGDSASDTPGLSHVHGLGINPADGQLYVASHHGVFRVSDGDAHRMGDLIQDTMGFTITGPDRFLGSGHPDIRDDTILDEGMPPLLGLIESANRAVTWSGISLQGQVDFHSLVFAHDRVYGFDSTAGRLMVSTDMKNWETRSQVSLWSLAVSPQDPDAILGTTDAGVVASRDGGLTWSGVEAPPLVFLSWDGQAGLWGISPDGSVHSSDDGGTTWAPRGRVGGQPAALLAHPSGLFAATSAAIYRSDDEGATWNVIYEIT